LAQRWIIQYNFYINDQRWGRMFVRMSPYLPFSARVCLNQHHWLAKRLMSEGIDFKQCSSDGDPLTSCHSTFPQPLQTNIACSAAYLGLFDVYRSHRFDRDLLVYAQHPSLRASGFLLRLKAR
jgi:hypothetical protein